METPKLPPLPLDSEIRKLLDIADRPGLQRLPQPRGNRRPTRVPVNFDRTKARAKGKAAKAARKKGR